MSTAQAAAMMPQRLIHGSAWLTARSFGGCHAGESAPKRPRMRRIFSPVIVHDLRQFAAISRAVAAAEAQQHAEIVNLDQVGKVRRIAAAQQLLQADEKLFPGGVRPE